MITQSHTETMREIVCIKKDIQWLKNGVYSIGKATPVREGFFMCGLNDCKNTTLHDAYTCRTCSPYCIVPNCKTRCDGNYCDVHHCDVSTGVKYRICHTKGCWRLHLVDNDHCYLHSYY